MVTLKVNRKLISKLLCQLAASRFESKIECKNCNSGRGTQGDW